MKAIANRLRLVAEFKRIDQHLKRHDNRLDLASRSVFEAAGWTCEIPMTLAADRCYVVYGSHERFLDSCAANLVLPVASDCKRILNEQVAASFGREYLNQNFGLRSQFRLRWFRDNCYDLKSKFFYLTSKSWFRPRKLAGESLTQELTRWLRNGSSLIVFPSGVFGNAKWRRGLGRLMLDHLENHQHYKLPLSMVGVQIQYSDRDRVVTVRVVTQHDPNSVAEIVAAELQANNSTATPIDIAITEYLERDYHGSTTGQGKHKLNRPN